MKSWLGARHQQDRPMRIAFYGNVANNFYQIVKALRGRAQIDAHLYFRSEPTPFDHATRK